jgi:hypothetical protein
VAQPNLASRTGHLAELASAIPSSGSARSAQGTEPSFQDSPIVVLPQILGGHPLLDEAMQAAGFQRDLQGLQRQWFDRDGIPVELLVPAGL